MILGIDFGTTNTLVAYVDKSLKPIIIPNERGSNIAPTAVHFKNKRQVLVGELAKSQVLLKPDQTVVNVKRNMGTEAKYEIFGELFTPSEIGSFVFRKCKKIAKDFFGYDVDKAVVTVPAYFDDNQRQAVVMAAKLAGLEVVKLLNEPTAAALAYDVDKEANILVLDFGGGTFDITLMHYEKGLYKVLATGGSSFLGGIDFDKVIAKWIIDTMKEEKGVDLSKDPIALQQVYNHSEKAKIDLSTVSETNIVIPYIALSAEHGPVHVNLTLTQERFNNLAKDLLEKSVELIKSVIKDAGMKSNNIDIVLFSGGTSRIPMFRKIVNEICPNAEKLGEFNPAEVVAIGAAKMAAVIEGRMKNVELLDIVPHSLGVRDDEGLFIPIIEKGTPYPTISTRLFTNTRDDQNNVIIQVLQNRENEIIELGDFELISKNKWKKNEANIAVSFQITHDGILNVFAEETNTGEMQEVTIHGPFADIRGANLDDSRIEFLNNIEVL